jgi:large-conductance mechanosensitive channel
MLPKDFFTVSEKMASAGTLLSDLDGKTPVFNQDDDFVNKILADMNVPSQQNPVMNAPPPPAGHGNRMISSPNPNTMYPHTMDPATSTAHLIGKDYPSPADFANVMHAANAMNAANGMGYGGSPYANVQQAPPAGYPTLAPSQGNLYAEVISQIKQPLIVAIIIFVVSLPALNVLIGHYLPSLLRIGGDLTTVGLIVKSAFGGFLFWFIQKILVPLMI